VRRMDADLGRRARVHPLGLPGAADARRSRHRAAGRQPHGRDHRGTEGWALASASNVPAIPRSDPSHNAHLIIAHVNSPLIEWFPTGGHRTGYTVFTELFDGEPEAADGWIEPGEAPVLGITLNDDALAEWALPS